MLGFDGKTALTWSIQCPIKNLHGLLGDVSVDASSDH